jgi:endonuclease YncB( thermonuclease family)
MMRIIAAFLLCVGLISAEPVPHIYPITEIIKIHDGDTVKVSLDLGFNLTIEYSIRIDGVDTPEVTGTEKEAGKVVREVAIKWINEAQAKGPLYAIYNGFGKYANRFVGDVLDIDGNSLSQYLLDNGWTKPWDGKGPSPTYSALELQAILDK